jgi:hypothetical protein
MRTAAIQALGAGPAGAADRDFPRATARSVTRSVTLATKENTNPIEAVSLKLADAQAAGIPLEELERAQREGCRFV